jgi:hypothetical protein
MYLHIGNGITVRRKNIIGIFDLDTATVSSITRNYINVNEKLGNIIYGDTDLPRAFVLHEEIKGNDKKYKIKLSRISASGLKLRAEDDGIGE